MTTVAVMAEPPVAGAAGTGFAHAGPLNEDDAASLYATMLQDVVAAVVASGADLLVNYRSAGGRSVAVDDPEAQVRDVVGEVVDDPTAVRYEVQVGSTFSARAGNTITHLLEREGVRTAAVVTPAAAFLGRQQVDSAAMKLRRSDVVLGPGTDGRVYYAAFAEPVDFTDAFEAPAVETLVERATDAGCDVDFLPMLPMVERPGDLSTAVPLLRARRRAGRRIPERTADRLLDLAIDLDADGATR